MKALSIRQPWSWLIVNGWKDIENRTWQTLFRGDFLIHASAGMTRREYEECKETVDHINDIYGQTILLPAPIDLSRGGIIGSATITDCVRKHPSPWFGGPFGFVIRKPMELPFQRYTGSLGFFKVEDERR